MRKKSGIFTNASSENERLILELLRINGPTPWQKICDQIALPKSTASRTMQRLCRKGLILEDRGKSRKRGPKPTIVKINTEGGFVAGAIVYPSYISIGLFTINLDLIETREVSLRDNSPHNVSTLLQTTLFNLLEKHHILKSKLISLGINIPGVILPNGIVKISSPLNWHDVPLKKIVSEYLPCHIIICEQIDVRGFVEFQSLSDFWSNRIILYTMLGHGFGSSLISDGRINFGSSGLCGEIGHIVVEPNGPICGCGHRGCAESLISGPVLAKRIKNDIQNGVQTLLSTKIKRDYSEKDIINQWGIAIQNEDSYALKLRDFVGEYFSRVIAIAINCFDPHLIILCGYVAKQCSKYLIEKIKDKIETEVCAGDLRNIKIITAGDEEIHFIKIAAQVALWDFQNT